MHLDKAIEHAKQCYPQESCGFFVLTKGKLRYYPCTNLAQDTQQEFVIGIEDYANAEKIGDITTVVHSHPDTSCLPSVLDLNAQQVSGFAWLIIGLEHGKDGKITTHYLPPISQQKSLYGREFIHGMTDCYGFIRDWYKQELHIDLPNYNRIDGWWDKGENLYVKNFNHAGFYPVTEARRGDMIVMQLNANVPNHAAVYLGDSLIGHHLYGRLSSKEVYGQYYRNRTTHIMRHKENKA